VFAGIVLVVVSSVRCPSVGADTANYQGYFVWINSLPFHERFSAQTTAWNAENIEWSFKMVNILLGLVTKQPYAITILLSVLTVVGLLRVASYSADGAAFSMFLFVVLGIYQASMNSARGIVAVLFALCSFHALRQRKFGQYLAWIALGTVFHLSALFFLPLWWLSRYRPRLRLIGILTIAAYVLGSVIYSDIVPLLSRALPERWDQYLAHPISSIDQIGVWAMVAFAFLLSILGDRVSTGGDIRIDGAKRVLFLAVNVGYALSTLNIMIGRLALFLGISVILFLPNSTEVDGFTGTLCLDTSRQHARLRLIAVVLLGAAFIVRLKINSVGNTVPYLMCLSPS